MDAAPANNTAAGARSRSGITCGVYHQLWGL